MFVQSEAPFADSILQLYSFAKNESLKCLFAVFFEHHKFMRFSFSMCYSVGVQFKRFLHATVWKKDFLIDVNIYIYFCL